MRPWVLLAAALAGCGGGAKQASPMDRWRADADAACDRAEQAIRLHGQVSKLERLLTATAGEEQRIA